MRDNLNKRGLLLTLPILVKMRPIAGWLDDEEADLLIACVVSIARGSSDAQALTIVEVGSYCGRSTVVLALAVRALCRETRVYAVDPHEGVLSEADRPLLQRESTLVHFEHNIRDACVEDLIEVVQKPSYEVEWRAGRPIDFLFIDGLHDYANVSRDFYHFAAHLRPGALVAFHDYSTCAPGVVAFVNKLLGMACCRRLECVKSLIVVEIVGDCGREDPSA